ncbi:uncharacterized protein I303_103000 [Kwoniella dejecticola CBS 10117]|uniref:Uncharacterized protein n=1 Tax=Kwoniella dejecticola CBS 10117 TaxID=1296121 RepID=A0A1A6AAB4_9TREE|nr:uncharacterized protein I303_03019 [Kwoniella dejecticola CBS 10117]OBR86997.1 hypothetical protein I303_03019 [Kwoniella dejecticola CBS 10117]
MSSGPQYVNYAGHYPQFWDDGRVIALDEDRISMPNICHFAGCVREKHGFGPPSSRGSDFDCWIQCREGACEAKGASGNRGHTKGWGPFDRPWPVHSVSALGHTELASGPSWTSHVPMFSIRHEWNRRRLEDGVQTNPGDPLAASAAMGWPTFQTDVVKYTVYLSRIAAGVITSDTPFVPSAPMDTNWTERDNWKEVWYAHQESIGSTQAGYQAGTEENPKSEP